MQKRGDLLMKTSAGRGSSLELKDGANVAVIGGGPTGSFFSIFALKMAGMIGKKLNVTIFDPKDFRKDGPGGCNRCGGIISELLVQTLAVEGINLSDSVVRKGINSYVLHTNPGDVNIDTPHLEKTIATVYRGGGPKGMVAGDKESFDNFLLKQAVAEGAVHVPVRIDNVEYRERPVLFSKSGEVMDADLVVGAFGVNSTASKIFEGLGFGYKEPPTVTAAIAELKMGEEVVAAHFGNSIHLFLLPDKGIKFAAMVPKGPYVSLCILGKDLNAAKVDAFLEKPVVKAVLTKDVPYHVECRCLPKMNVGAPKKPFTDRIVMCGDAGSTRLFKDGLGAAYLMGKAAAKTAVFRGVGEEDFRADYYPVYKDIVVDNFFGRYLYMITDIYRKNRLLTKGLIETVRKEQGGADDFRPLSSMLWDMFTGNERYKRILPKALSIKMHVNLWGQVAKALTSSNHKGPH
jgi:flavin-dependent dehydrogenase